MNNSKKLLYVRIVLTSVIVLFVSFFIFLIIKIDVVGSLFDNKKYIENATKSNVNIDSYDIDIGDSKDEKEIEIQFVEKQEEKNETVVDKSIFKYIDAIKNKRKSTYKSINNDGLLIDLTLNDKKNEFETQKSVEREIKKIQNYYNNGYYTKNSWIIIDDDFDGYGYNYYFNNNGKLSTDTVTSDYKIVDKYGREIDDDLEPILYKIKNISTFSNVDGIDYNINTIKSLKSTQTIISDNVSFKKNDNIYNANLNRRVIDYIDTSLRFKKTTNGTIYDGSKWKSVSALMSDGGYVIFNNPFNNFNKIIGKITTQQLNNNSNTNFIFLVYDADLYDIYKGYEHLLEPLFETEGFNNSSPLDFSFTFFRSVKRLRFQIESDDENKNISCYLKDLRFGFNKQKYKEELEESKNNKEYIEYLKKLGIYNTDEDFLNDLKELEDNNQSDYLEYADFNDIDLYDDVDLSDYDINIDREQLAIDRRTGPAFDDYLRNLKNFWELEYGPGFQ